MRKKNAYILQFTLALQWKCHQTKTQMQSSLLCFHSRQAELFQFLGIESEQKWPHLSYHPRWFESEKYHPAGPGVSLFTLQASGFTPGQMPDPKNAKRGNTRRGDVTCSHKLWWRQNKCYEFRSFSGYVKFWPGNHRKSFTPFFCAFYCKSSHTQEATQQSLTGVFCGPGTFAHSCMKYLFTPNPHTFSYIKTVLNTFYVHIFPTSFSQVRARLTCPQGAKH